jgi:antitoxin MazE
VVPCRFFKWGNKLAVGLPEALVDQLGLKEDDELEVVAASDSTIKVETKEARRQRALDNIRARKWTFPPEASKDQVAVAEVDQYAEFLRQAEQSQFPLADGFKFDRDEANKR